MTSPRIDHIGLIVDNLDETLALFEKMFGLKPAGRKELPEAGLLIAELKASNISLELIQYQGPPDSFGRKVMGDKTGYNHISVAVDDAAQMIKTLADKGVETMEGFPAKGSHGLVAFFKPETTKGLLMEICQKDAKHP